MSAEAFTEAAARAWMLAHIEEHRDPKTSELDMTSIAEACAAAFGEDDEGGPLDDETHWIWDLAFEAHREAEQLFWSGLVP